VTTDDALASALARDVPLGAFADVGWVRFAFVAVRTGPYLLSMPYDPDTGIASLAPRFPLYAWDEREMMQERGIRVEGHPDPRPLRSDAAGTMPRPIVADGPGVTRIVVGPVHAGIIEPGRFTISSGGETIVHLDAQLGYQHRGIERVLEGRSVTETAHGVARVCGSCSAARSYAFASAVESIAGLCCDPAVELARLIVCELERLYNHLADLAACCAGAGWRPGFVRGLALKEEAMRLCARAGGHRLLFDTIAPGGVKRGLLDDRRAVRVELDALAVRVERYLDRLFSHPSLNDRWHRAGIIGHDVARALGLVGPAHRASRGAVDLRAFAPYGAYAFMPPRVATASAGDVLARCRVKRDELRDTLRLLQAALRELGDASLPPPRTASWGDGTAVSAVEGPRGAEIAAVRLENGGRIACINLRSASFRNWPGVARAMDGGIVPDFPLVNKSFNLCYACVDR